MPDLDRYLYDQLRSQAAGVDVPAGDIDAIKARGRHRRHHRAGASVLAVVAAAGTVTGVAVSNSSGGQHGQIFVGAPTSLPAATGHQLDWRVVPANGGLSDLSSQSSSGSIAYAVSTAPGVVPAGSGPAQQLYRSADGLSWTTATGPAGVSAAAVAVDGNRVYTVGTGPATAATGVSGAMTTTVSWTEEGSDSWQKSVLPVDLNAPAGALSVNDEAVNVAAGPTGVVAAVSINATADLSRLVRGVSSQAIWTTNANGVEVLGSQVSSKCGFGAGKGGPALNQIHMLPRAAALKLKYAATHPPVTGHLKGTVRAPLGAAIDFGAPPAPDGQIGTVPCVAANGHPARFVPADQAYRVVKTYSWSQLNLGGEAEQVLEGEPLVFFSSDGADFHQVSLPAGTSGQAYVTATRGGFAMEVPGTDGPPVVMQSADGQHWSPVPFSLPAETTGASGIGYVDGHLVVVGQTQTGSAAYTLLSGGWHTTALPENVTAVSFGPLGVSAVGVSASGDPGSWQVLYSQNGLNWSSASLVSLTRGAVEDANVVVGAHQVIVTVTRSASAEPSARPPVQVQVVGTPAA